MCSHHRIEWKRTFYHKRTGAHVSTWRNLIGCASVVVFQTCRFDVYSRCECNSRVFIKQTHLEMYCAKNNAGSLHTQFFVSFSTRNLTPFSGYCQSIKCWFQLTSNATVVTCQHPFEGLSVSEVGTCSTSINHPTHLVIVQDAHLFFCSSNP